MAIDQGTETLTVKTQERTWRINIESAMDTDYVFTVHRETVKTDPAGIVVSKVSNAIVVTRGVGAIADQEYVVGGQTYTTQEIANVIAEMADTWRKEDLAAPPPVGPGGPSRR
jgi:hypothetical protein